jgi:hypothetical protein
MIHILVVLYTTCNCFLYKSEDQLADQQQQIELERKERNRTWHRRKDEDMRKKLLQAYRPYFPNDVFNKKSGSFFFPVAIYLYKHDLFLYLILRVSEI